MRYSHDSYGRLLRQRPSTALFSWRTYLHRHCVAQAGLQAGSLFSRKFNMMEPRYATAVHEGSHDPTI